ncbi:MAG: hypothetical protein HUU50_09010 [Candidatus Brocadiae bacterium]|nr:hypothetical protein [Candidatus Brocadiia bacterium]
MKVLCFIGLWIFLFCFSGVSANQTKQEFYYELWCHSSQIMQKVWDEWEKEHAFLTQEECYFAAKLSYFCQDQQKATQYFKYLAKSKKSQWQEISCLWDEYLSYGYANLKIKDNLSCFLGSEIALLAHVMGDKNAWKQSHAALQEAKTKKQDLCLYWQNLAMTQPEDKDLWKKSLWESLANFPGDKPFFNPYLFYSLYAYASQEGDIFPLDIGGSNADQDSSWSLAFFYGKQGYFYSIAGEKNRADLFFQNSLNLYNSIFYPGYRGNLDTFSLLHIVQMSQIWLLCECYDDMLFYLYRPDSREGLGIASVLFRPALQFLAAVKIKNNSRCLAPAYSLSPFFK